MDRLDGRTQELDVVAVRSVDCPAGWYAVPFDADLPLPATFRPIFRVLAGCLRRRRGPGAACRRWNLAQVETDDPIERGDRFGVDLVEDASVDPFVVAGAQVS